VTQRECARILRSAASDLEHGRPVNAQKKILQIVTSLRIITNPDIDAYTVELEKLLNLFVDMIHGERLTKLNAASDYHALTNQITAATRARTRLGR